MGFQRDKNSKNKNDDYGIDRDEAVLAAAGVRCVFERNMSIDGVDGLVLCRQGRVRRNILNLV